MLDVPMRGWSRLSQRGRRPVALASDRAHEARATGRARSSGVVSPGPVGSAHGYPLVNAIIVRQTLVHDIPSIMSRIRVRLDATQTAPTAGDHASAAEGAPGVAPRTDTGAILEARADKLDRA